MSENKGVIYILTNPSFPEYVKIGYADDIEKRLQQLNRSECIPFAFRVYATYEVNSRLSDIKIHTIIDKLNPNLRSVESFNGKQRVREFYAMSPEDAYSILEAIAEIHGCSDMDFVRQNLPVELRTGTIRQSDLWEIWPETRTRFFDGITDEEIEEIKVLLNKQPQGGYKPEGRIASVTANDFFNYCAIGYKAMSYKWYGMTPRELYYRYADGRDEGLSEIDADSPEAFSKWLNNKSRGGGHPWEVCRGGNSTHIALQVGNDDKGFFLFLAGSSYGRANETLKFFLALSRAGLPVYLHDSDVFINRIQGTEKIGVMPQGVIPKYCGSAFPDEKIISFMNLPYEDTEAVASKCVWQDIKEVHLLTEEG